jgi:hypothetical protein
MRTKFAGILQAPPAMVESIYEWVVAIIAAKVEERTKESLADLEGRIELCGDFARFLSEAETVIRAGKGLKVEFAAYKTIIGQRLFYPVTNRLFIEPKLSEFKVLRENGRALEILAEWRDNLRDYLRDSQRQVQQYDATFAEIREYLLPGVDANTGFKIFPVDLTGWKYDAKFLPKLDALRKEKLDWVNSLNTKKDLFPDIHAALLEAAENTWRGIKVVIAGKRELGGLQWLASWNAAMLTLTFNGLVESLTPKALGDLRRNIRHELQHMAQTLISDTLKTKGGLAPLKALTPDYSQNATDPERAKLIQKLRRQGVEYVTRENIYHLDDLEYMTQLSDAIAAFERLEEKHVIPNRKSAILRFIGGKGPFDEFTQGNISPNPFFVSLRKLSAAKYREAAREFVKAIL